jgi:hypothetical protein
MAEGGFLVKFDGKEVERCFAVSFDYDDWQYVVNGKETKSLPEGLENIVVTIETKP